MTSAKLGFCLPREEEVRLVEDSPNSASAFVDAVFRAEGLDPETAGRRLYRRVHDMVADAFPQAEDAYAASLTREISPP